MTPEVNALIGSIRTRMESQLEELGLLREEDSAPGESGAVNGDDILDRFDAMIGQIADALLDEFDMSEDEAIDFVFDVADGMAEDGVIPDLPDDDDVQAVALWIGKAETAGLAAEVIKAAEEMADE